MKSHQVKFEIPRRAAPAAVATVLGDRHDPVSVKAAGDVPPGHRFLLYFHGMADKGNCEYVEGDKALKRSLNDAKNSGDWRVFAKNAPNFTDQWVPLKDGRRHALQACAGMGKAASDLLEALAARAEALRPKAAWRRDALLTSPLATGLGNPHPVENGFAFLSPYGVPYLAGSGVKGVLRRAAEELALFEPASPWRLSHVWALFGFDENSACFDRGRDKPADPEWTRAYGEWARHVSAAGDPVLEAWLEAVRGQLPAEGRALPPAGFLTALGGDQGLRRSVHWQGLLAFDDALPDPRARLAVDILNPHHKSYFEGKGSPHDAENPVPVFFLTVAPGARFTFAARPLAGRAPVWEATGDWRALLDAAFGHAADWLGFGAKTRVGYGAFSDPDRAPVAAQPAAAGASAGPAAPATRTPVSAPAETRWEKAQLKFNRSNGTLTARGPDNKEAHARAPRGKALYDALPPNLRADMERGKPVRVCAVVSGGELARIELPEGLSSQGAS
jgi:CRISPR-associated protein Cmr6